MRLQQRSFIDRGTADSIKTQGSMRACAQCALRVFLEILCASTADAVDRQVSAGLPVVEGSVRACANVQGSTGLQHLPQPVLSGLHCRHWLLSFCQLRCYGRSQGTACSMHRVSIRPPVHMLQEWGRITACWCFTLATSAANRRRTMLLMGCDCVHYFHRSLPLYSSCILLTSLRRLLLY